MQSEHTYVPTCIYAYRSDDLMASNGDAQFCRALDSAPTCRTSQLKYVCVDHPGVASCKLSQSLALFGASYRAGRLPACSESLPCE